MAFDGSPGDASPAQAWRARGSTFTWAPPDGAPAVDVFHVEEGDRDLPVLLLVHGFPTCSVDWCELLELLVSEFRVCALDFPGYGFSSKPHGWGYNLERDALLLDHYLTDVVGTQSAVVLAHDRGSSVAMIHALRSIRGEARTHVEHLLLTNGNIYLPLSNLTEFQRRMLDPATAPDVLAVLTPTALAQGMGRTTFSPPQSADHPDVQALEDTFAYNDGIQVMHETIQYLVERAEHEQAWLAELATASLPTTVAWGMRDAVSPVRVAAYVWTEFLMQKPGRNRFYLVPEANHYLQNDRPDALAAVLRHTLDPDSDSAPGAISAEPGSPVLVDCSRAEMPVATTLFKHDAPT